MQLYGISPVHPHCFSPGGEDNFPALIQVIVGAEFAPPMIDRMIALGCVIHGDHKDLERHTETMPELFGGGRFWGADVSFPTWHDYHTWWHWVREKMCTDSSFPVVNMTRQYRSAVPVYYETAVAAIVYPSVKKEVTPPVRDTKEQNDAFYEFMEGVVAKDRFPYDKSEHLKKVAQSIADEMKKPGYARQILGHVNFPTQEGLALDANGNPIRVTGPELLENLGKYMAKHGTVPAFHSPQLHVVGQDRRYLTPEDKATGEVKLGEEDRQSIAEAIERAELDAAQQAAITAKLKPTTRELISNCYLTTTRDPKRLAESIGALKDHLRERVVNGMGIPQRLVMEKTIQPRQEAEKITLKLDPRVDQEAVKGFRDIEAQIIEKMRRREDISRRIKVTPKAFETDELPNQDPFWVTTVDVELPDNFTQVEAEWAINLTAGLFPWPEHLTRLSCSRLDGSVEAVAALIEQPGVIAIHMYRPVIRRQDEGYVYDHESAHTKVQVKDTVNETDSKRLLDMARHAFRNAVWLEEERFRPGPENITVTVTGLPDQHRRLHKE